MKNRKSSIVNRQSVLSLDPSSTAVGWAVMASATAIVEGGLITPERQAAPYIERVFDIVTDLDLLLDSFEPATILIEIPTGKVHRRKRPYTHGMGLSVYGFGVGAVWLQCHQWCRRRPSQIIPIFANDWTRGVAKRDRQIAIASMFDHYRIADDPGGDAADAIGMAVWWFRQRNLWNLFARR